MAFKYLGLTTLFFVIATAGKGQFLPLLSASHEWSNVEIHCLPQGNSYTSSRLVIGQDTLFDGYLCKTIWSVSPNSPLYYGAMREDIQTGKIWYRYPYSTSEGLVYDFALQPGDTARLVNQLFGIDTLGLVITARDSVYMNNQWRAKLTLTNFELSLQEWWIEGIGSSWGLLNSGNSFYAAACGGQELLCFWEDGVQVFQNQAFPTCDFTPTGQPGPDDALSINIFPNPASQTITIENSPPDALLSLYSLDGVAVSRSAGGGTIRQMNVSHLPSGLYTLTLSTRGQVMTRRVVISR